MADHFFDTSALGKHYQSEVGTAMVVALALHQPTRPISFVCADRALCSIATAEGLTVINPEVP